MEIFILTILSIVLLIVYILNLRKYKFTTKTMVIIAMFSGLSLILYMIHFIKYPQGGGITLFSMLPIMLLSIMYGNIAGVTGGLIFGVLKLFNNSFGIIHPVQFLLDYIFSTMALGLAGTFGSDNKFKIIIGGLFATFISITMCIISGAVFFGQYAPKSMNVWLYSFIYNFSSGGVEGILTTVLLVFIPIKRLKK